MCVCVREGVPPSLPLPSLTPFLHPSFLLPEGREGEEREGEEREGGREEWIDRGREREIVSQNVNTYL